jgi:hypothetical protein
VASSSGRGAGVEEEMDPSVCGRQLHAGLGAVERCSAMKRIMQRRRRKKKRRNRGRGRNSNTAETASSDIFTH